MVGAISATGLLLLSLHFCLCQQEKDESRVISVARTDNDFEVLTGEEEFDPVTYAYHIM